MIPIEDFFKKYGIETEKLDNKEKLKILKRIIFTIGVEKDLEELSYAKNKESKTITESEYINNIRNLSLIQFQAQCYIFMIKQIKKEERKLKRKANYQKIIKAFKK